jgi:hypothetical protein
MGARARTGPRPCACALVGTPACVQPPVNARSTPSSLVNESNIRPLTRELLDYLAVSDAEFKPDLTSKICMLIQRCVPTLISFPCDLCDLCDRPFARIPRRAVSPGKRLTAVRTDPSSCRLIRCFTCFRSFAPDKRWHFDQLLAVMLQVGAG